MLVLDADLRQSLVTARALGRAGVSVSLAETHPCAPAFASRWCSGQTVVPDFAQDADAFVDAVIDLCGSIGHPVVITSHDGAIQALRARRSEVEGVASLALASEDALSAAIDKRATLAAGERLGAWIPRGRPVEHLDDAAAAISELGLPVVIKPVASWVDNGAGAWRASAEVAKSRGDAMAHAEQLLNASGAVLIQPWLSGPREAVSIFFADGRVWASFAQRSLRDFPLLGGAAVVRESIEVPFDVGPLAEALVRKLSLEGYSQVEFRRDEQGRPYLMEINSRPSASIEIAVRAGVNFPLLQYRWAAGQPLQQAGPYRRGMRVRYLHGDVEWLKRVLRDPQHPDAPRRASAIGTFLADFVRPASYDYWDLRDIRPSMLIASRLARTLPRRLVKGLPFAGTPAVAHGGD